MRRRLRPPRPGDGSLAAAIFDMDGLLIDSEPLWRAAEIEVFARHGLALTDAQASSTKGMFVSEAVAHWYGLHPWTGASPDQVAAEIVTSMASQLSSGARAKRGARRAVAQTRRRGLKLAVASSSPLQLIEVGLGALGLVDAFEVVHSAEHEPAGKPDPAVFLTTAARLGVEPGRCVVFEDSTAGVAAARAAGMVCVAVPEDGPTRTGGSADADVVLSSLARLGPAVWRVLESRVGAPSGRHRT